MSEQDDASKTEEPTQKRLDDSRQKGQVVQSRDLGSFIMLGAGALAIFILGPWMMKRVMSTAALFIERPQDIRLNTGNLMQAFSELLLALGFALLLPLLILVIGAVASGMLQFGLLFATEQLGFKWERVSLVKGFSRLFSMRTMVEFLKGVAKIVLVSACCVYVISPELTHLERMVTTPIQALLPIMTEMMLKLVMAVLAVLFVLAGGDYFYQRFAHMKQLRMSKQEIKDEHKQSEGDPHIKARLRQIRNQRARKRMMANVPKATVVVTNPTHYSVALAYTPGMAAPKVVAKGVDEIAFKIREVAREHRVPLVANPPLARSLYATVDIDQEIPAEHYKAVAEVISFVMRAGNRSGRPAGAGPVGAGPAGGGAGPAGGRPIDGN
ncbi:flagellar biosynthesis protein FlhB [Lacibacterium aquatile]|uniref:Flagellar biosynthetic protein FlhB n=1 Tax=Lacibacterium aquatile TaxID=1168082 RepID=A0ABW5DMP6_9PROT